MDSKNYPGIIRWDVIYPIFRYFTIETTQLTLHQNKSNIK